jgi:hypothetical protein
LGAKVINYIELTIPYLFITIALAVLNIILFFKIWGMANDIREFRKRLLGKSYEDQVRKLILTGNKDDARVLIIDKFFERISGGIFGIDYSKQFLEQELSQLGENLPEWAENLKSLDNFKDTFKTSSEY